MYQVTINSTQIQNLPEGLDNFSIARKINYDDFLIEFEYASDLTFTLDGYELLKRLREEDYCQLIDVTIRKLCDTGYDIVLEAEARLTNMEIDNYKCTARIVLIQKDLITRIKNNWDKETSITGGVDVFNNTVAVPTASNISFNRPFDGSFYANIPVFTLKDAFQYYANYLTGSSLVVVSNWYDNLDDDKFLGITSGESIRNQDTAGPITNFEDLFKDHAKAFNLFMGIVYNGDTPELRIEEESFWFNTTPVVNRNSIKKIDDRYNEDRLFSTVEFGSKTIIEGDGTNGESLPFLSLFGFGSEKFAVTGSCNLKQTLDLSLQNIVDSNVIEDIIVNSTTSYDQDCFYIQVTSSTNSATQATDLIPLREIFNQVYLSSEVVQRWNFQGDLARNRKIQDNTYRAYTPIGAAIPLSNGDVNLTFTNDSTPPYFDTSGNWDTTQSRYTCPENDLYIFTLQYLFRVTSLGSLSGLPARFLLAKAVKYDSGGTKLEEYTGERIDYWNTNYGINPSPGDIHRVNDSFYVYADATDYVEFVLAAVTTAGTVTDSVQLYVSGFEQGTEKFQESACVLNKSAGGIVSESTPENYKIEKYKFEDKLSTKEMIDVIRQPNKAIGFTGSNVDRKLGWGNVEFKLGKENAVFDLTV